VPESTPAELRVTPLGSVPLWVKVGVGKPLAVTVKVPGELTVKVARLLLVIPGAWRTVSVKFWVASVPVPLVALTTME
jgi:hypothetical protein